MIPLNRLIVFIFCAAFLPIVYLIAQGPSEAVLIQNMANVEELPKRFRTTNDALKLTKKIPPPSTRGLANLRASGSGQFSQKSLEAILKKLGQPSHLYVVDLRQESHGFINGIAVSWYAYRDWGNKGKSLQQIEEEQQQLLDAALKKKNVTIYKNHK